MKTINISTLKYPNQFAIVDNKDFEWLNQWKWRTHSKGYAIRMTGGRKEAKTIYMHRLINNTPKGLETDHINRNKLDNRKKNLRSVTGTQNKLNTGLWKNNQSGFKGVSLNKNNGEWKAQIQLNNKNIILGHYTNINEAILTRKQAERRLFS